MSRAFLLIFVFLFTAFTYCQAGIIRGRVTNERNEALLFATLLIKGTTEGTTTNADGQYHLEPPPGTYTVVCQYMGYRKEEKQVTLPAATADLTLNFQLQPLSMQIREVIVKGGGEDPAYAIIRQAPCPVVSV